MAKSLQEILGGRQMTGLIRAVRTGLPRANLPDSLFRVTNKVIGDKANYLKVFGTRENARATQYGGPARMVAGKSLAETAVTLLHSFEQQAHNPLVLQALIGMNGDAMQEQAIEQIDLQTLEFKTRFENLRLSAVFSLIAKGGKIWLDANGLVQFTSSGAAITIDFGVPAANVGTVDGIFATTWNTASVDIIANINAVKRKALQTTGRPLKYAMYGKNVPGYVFKNDIAKNVINGNAALSQQAYSSGNIPNGFCELTWLPGDVAFGLNSSNAITEWFDGDQISFFPEPDPSWWRFMEGSMPIPRSIDVKADAVAAARDLELVYGQFGYAVTGHNPPGITQFAGDTFMPILASPADLYNADVVP